MQVKRVFYVAIAGFWTFSLTGSYCAVAAAPCPARIDYVVPAPAQPHGTNPAVIWYDDFDSDRTGVYVEPEPGAADATLSSTEALGGRGRSMECFYAYTSRGRGNRKLVFGDSPIGKPLRKGERFPCVYWRIYVKHERGWQGAPDKLSRATGIVSTHWNQAFIAHVWGAGNVLTLDPATGVQEGRVTTSGYNDFSHLRWLGNKPVGTFPLHDEAESGRWVCVEAMVRVNTPGQQDGRMALWVDGKLDAERIGLDFRGSYTGTGSTVNAIFLEAYWNAGAPRDLYRWYDDFVVSTNPIGPITAPIQPTIARTGVECAEWQVELGTSGEHEKVLWASRSMSGKEIQITANAETGAFLGEAETRKGLLPGQAFWCRIRIRTKPGAWSAWSDWHQPFQVASSQQERDSKTGIGR